MTDTMIEQRMSSGAGEALRESVSETPPLKLPKVPYLFTVAGAGVASLAGFPTSAAAPQPRTIVQPAEKAFLTSEEYLSLESRLMSIYTNNVVALATLNSRMDELATVVALLVRNQATGLEDGSQASREDIPDAATLLNRACDEGIFDPAVKVLAERELMSTDKFARLAAIRAISLMDPSRGRELIAAELSKEGSAVIRGALEGTLRAIS